MLEYGKIEIDELTGNYTCLSNDFIRNPVITPNDKTIFAVIKSWPDNFDFNAKNISKDVGLNIKTVQKSLRHLEELGYLDRKGSKWKGQYTKSLYLIFNDPKNDLRRKYEEQKGIDEACSYLKALDL